VVVVVVVILLHGNEPQDVLTSNHGKRGLVSRPSKRISGRFFQLVTIVSLYILGRSIITLKFDVVLKQYNIPGADKSLARPGGKQPRKYVRDARDFNNTETRAVINFFFLQGKAPKEIHAILTETLARFRPGRAKDLSAPL